MICYEVTLLNVSYSYKQIFEQRKNMDHRSTSIRDIMIYLNQLHCQKTGLQNLEWLGAVHTQEEQPAACIFMKIAKWSRKIKMMVLKTVYNWFKS